jgi:hypothetical protein
LPVASHSLLWDGTVSALTVTRHDELGRPSGQNKPTTENAAFSPVEAMHTAIMVREAMDRGREVTWEEALGP